MDRALGSLFYGVGKRKIFLGLGMGQGRAKKCRVRGEAPFFEGRPSLNQTINFVEGLDLRLGWDGMGCHDCPWFKPLWLLAWSDDGGGGTIASHKEHLSLSSSFVSVSVFHALRIYMMPFWYTPHNSNWLHSPQELLFTRHSGEFSKPGLDGGVLQIFLSCWLLSITPDLILDNHR